MNKYRNIYSLILIPILIPTPRRCRSFLGFLCTHFHRLIIVMATGRFDRVWTSPEIVSISSDEEDTVAIAPGETSAPVEPIAGTSHDLVDLSADSPPPRNRRGEIIHYSCTLRNRLPTMIHCHWFYLSTVVGFCLIYSSLCILHRHFQDTPVYWKTGETWVWTVCQERSRRDCRSGCTGPLPSRRRHPSG